MWIFKIVVLCVTANCALSTFPFPRICSSTPPAIANGTFEPYFFGFSPGHAPIIVYKCNPGFELEGVSVSFCTNARWSSLPRCVPSKGCSGLPPTPRFGSFDYLPVPEGMNYTHIVYKCDPEHDLLGLRGTFCRNGKWAHSEPPRCYINYCASNPCEFDADCENRIGRFTCACRRGYIWKPEEGKCTKPCVPPKPPTGTQYFPKRVNYREGNRIAYLTICRGDRKRTRERSIFVCRNGEFRGTFPTCSDSLPLPVTCLPPLPPLDGEVIPSDKDSYLVGEQVTFMCQNGTRLLGLETSRCMEDGRFDQPTPYCFNLEEESSSDNYQE